MIYTLLDTSIYYRIITQGQPGCEMEFFDKYKQLAAESKLVALVPEVVLLELDKRRRRMADEYEGHFAKLDTFVRDAVSKKEIWNELGDVKNSLLELLKTTREDKRKLIEDRFEHVNTWLRSDAVVPIPFTPEIWFRANRRLMQGRMPNSDRRSDQDACIVESASETIGKRQLYLCSANFNDFAVAVGDRFGLHPILEEDFPGALFFVDLRSLVEAVSGEKAVSTPTPEEIKQAAASADLAPVTPVEEVLIILANIRPIIEEFRRDPKSALNRDQELTALTIRYDSTIPMLGGYSVSEPTRRRNSVLAAINGILGNILAAILEFKASGIPLARHRLDMFCEHFLKCHDEAQRLLVEASIW